MAPYPDVRALLFFLLFPRCLSWLAVLVPSFGGLCVCVCVCVCARVLVCVRVRVRVHVRARVHAGVGVGVGVCSCVPCYDKQVAKGSLKSNFQQYGQTERQKWEESERRREEERRSDKRKNGKREEVGAPKCKKVAIHVVFRMICGYGGWKSRLAKAAGAEPSGQMRDEKLHAVVVRSTCGSQNVQSTSAPDRFWKLKCRKSARCSCAKHKSKRKRTKHTNIGTLFGSCEVEKVHALEARSTCPSQKCKSRRSRTTFGS